MSVLVPDIRGLAACPGCDLLYNEAEEPWLEWSPEIVPEEDQTEEEKEKVDL